MRVFNEKTLTCRLSVLGALGVQRVTSGSSKHYRPSTYLKPAGSKSLVVHEVARWAARNQDHMRTTSMPAPAAICTPVLRSETVPPCCPAPSIILDERHRLSRKAPSFFTAVRVFLTNLADKSAFQELSSGREVSIIFTSNGPLIYRWESNNGNPPTRS